MSVKIASEWWKTDRLSAFHAPRTSYENEVFKQLQNGKFVNIPLVMATNAAGSKRHCC